jgi:hypothetical protein
MTPLFKKLNFKNHTEIGCFNAPASFETELNEMKKTASIIKEIEHLQKGNFMIAFTITQKEVDYWATTLVSKMAHDGVLWFCYPKGSSKKYKCDFNRDTGWEILGKLGLEPVRQVAIDEDWSALRFRKPELIKTMTRTFAMTAEGKKKVAQGRK